MSSVTCADSSSMTPRSSATEASSRVGSEKTRPSNSARFSQMLREMVVLKPTQSVAVLDARLPRAPRRRTRGLLHRGCPHHAPRPDRQRAEPACEGGSRWRRAHQMPSVTSGTPIFSRQEINAGKRRVQHTGIPARLNPTGPAALGEPAMARPRSGAASPRMPFQLLGGEVDPLLAREIENGRDGIRVQVARRTARTSSS